MKIEIDNYGNIIHKNGGGNTHVTKITAFSREEDEAQTVVTTIYPTTKQVVSSVVKDCTSNPSPRRHGIVLDIEDEATREISQLAIYQHKGCTYIEWL